MAELHGCWRAHSRKFRACATLVLSGAAIVETYRFWFVWIPAVIATATVRASAEEHELHPEQIAAARGPELLGPLITPFFAVMYAAVEDRLVDSATFAVLCARPSEWPPFNMVCVANGSNAAAAYTVVAGAELPTP
eukprot:7088321-Prymnesium_polylepis.1